MSDRFFDATKRDLGERPIIVLSLEDDFKVNLTSMIACFFRMASSAQCCCQNAGKQSAESIYHSPFKPTEKEELTSSNKKIIL